MQQFQAAEEARAVAAKEAAKADAEKAKATASEQQHATDAELMANEQDTLADQTAVAASGWTTPGEESITWLSWSMVKRSGADSRTMPTANRARSSAQLRCHRSSSSPGRPSSFCVLLLLILAAGPLMSRLAILLLRLPSPSLRLLLRDKFHVLSPPRHCLHSSLMPLLKPTRGVCLLSLRSPLPLLVLLLLLASP